MEISAYVRRVLQESMGAKQIRAYLASEKVEQVRRDRRDPAHQSRKEYLTALIKGEAVLTHVRSKEYLYKVAFFVNPIT